MYNEELDEYFEYELEPREGDKMQDEDGVWYFEDGQWWSE